MKNLLKIAMLSIAMTFMFVSVENANAQNGRRMAKREYRQDMRQAKRNYRQNRREAVREYRSSTGRRYNKGYYTSTNRRRMNHGYYVSRSRRAYPQNYRVYYRNGRRYVVRNN